MMAKDAKISTDDSLEIYKTTMQVFTQDGTMPVDAQQRIIGFQKSQLKIEKELPPEQIYDFRIIQSLLHEVKK